MIDYNRWQMSDDDNGNDNDDYNDHYNDDGTDGNYDWWRLSRMIKNTKNMFSKDHNLPKLMSWLMCNFGQIGVYDGLTLYILF